MKSTEKLNRVSFEEIVEEDGATCLVIFSRKTCHVCQAVHGKLNALEKDYPNLSFYHVDVEEEPQLQEKFRLRGVSHVLFFQGGEICDRLSGNNEEDVYTDKIEALL